jgi:hypothetical protein
MGIFLLLAAVSVYGQQRLPAPPARLPRPVFAASLADSLKRTYTPGFRLSGPVPVFSFAGRQPEGWFCRQEWRLEKSTGIPFRFRLGSLEQVNWLERKPNALPPSFAR